MQEYRGVAGTSIDVSYPHATGLDAATGIRVVG